MLSLSTEDHGLSSCRLGPRGASLVAQTVKNPPALKETWVQSLGWEDSLEKGMETHSSILAWRIPMDRGIWQATVHGVTKSWTQLSMYACRDAMRKGFSYVWAELCLVTQLCPTFCGPMDCSPPGSSVHGIFQARILEWVVISYSRGSS